MTKRKEKISLALCWITLIGCVMMFIGAADLAATNPEAFVAGLVMWVTSITSFYCAYTLRKLIVNEITN
jgi:hypothetical protein